MVTFTSRTFTKIRSLLYSGIPRRLSTLRESSPVPLLCPMSVRSQGWADRRICLHQTLSDGFHDKNNQSPIIGLAVAGTRISLSSRYTTSKTSGPSLVLLLSASDPLAAANFISYIRRHNLSDQQVGIMERAAPCNDVPVIAIKTSIGNKKGQHLRRSDLKKAKQLLLWLASSPKSVCVILPGCSCYTCQPMIYTSQRQSHPTERDIHRTLCTHGLTLNWHSVSVLVPLALNAIDMVSNNKLINWAQLHAKKEWALWWGNGKSKAARQLRSIDLS